MKLLINVYNFPDKLLGHLLQLSLNESEEMHLEQYLRARAEPHALEPLFLYYLHHSRFLQAFQLNEDMKKMDRVSVFYVRGCLKSGRGIHNMI